MRILISWGLIFIVGSAVSQQSYLKRLKTIDVQKYDFNIAVYDSTDEIKGYAQIDVIFKKNTKTFTLDLKSVGSDGTGMSVDLITDENGSEVSWTHEYDKVTIQSNNARIGELHSYTINYHGIPSDGLIIDKNMHGDRTFFGDNWPNRAFNWLPCVDHPSDKALLDWTIHAPDRYDVIANGIYVDRVTHDHHTDTRWSSSVPLPPKVMVVGIADFAVQESGMAGNVPVSSWVYKQDRNNGFSQYSIGPEVLTYFINKIGPYPYEKLANVQSKTRFGGMENAGNIFYYEQSTDPRRDVEGLFAHEIAHQWFGNSVTEIDWPHVWLSEGFATYMTDLYFEDKYGNGRLMERMENERTSVIDFSKKKEIPLVDKETKDFMQLLNANSYQKGAWVLHMLRREVGDQIFFLGLKSYYKEYRDGNASSDDLCRVFENLSGKNLKQFFKQWLNYTGHPILTYSIESKVEQTIIGITQQQKKIFKFPVDIKVTFENGDSEIQTFNVKRKRSRFKLHAKQPVSDLSLDPNIRLLWEPAAN